MLANKPKKQLEIMPSIGETFAVGWLRDDMPNVVHVFANALQGQIFKPGNGFGGPHWPCKVCEAHGYSEEDFDVQMRALMGLEVVDA